MTPNVHLHLSLTGHRQTKSVVFKKEEKEIQLATCTLPNHIKHQLLRTANCCQFDVN